MTGSFRDQLVFRGQREGAGRPRRRGRSDVAADDRSSAAEGTQLRLLMGSYPFIFGRNFYNNLKKKKTCRASKHKYHEANPVGDVELRPEQRRRFRCHLQRSRQPGAASTWVRPAPRGAAHRGGAGGCPSAGCPFPAGFGDHQELHGLWFLVILGHFKGQKDS